MHDTRHHHRSAGSTWARLVVVLLARAYRSVLLTLSAAAILPLLLTSMAGYVIDSGSMRPTISEGDVVVARPFAAGERVDVGRVYVFEDPAVPGRLLVHRIVERRDDGDFTTAGDANDLTDVTPLDAADIRGRGVLLVPYAGLPVHWMHTGQWWRLALWLLLTVGAFLVAARRLEDEPPSWLQRLRRRVRRRRAVPPPPRRPAVPVAASLAVVLFGGVLSTGTANAAFTSRTTSHANTWAAGAGLQRYVAAVQADQPYGFWLLDEPSGSTYAVDRSGNDRTGQYYGALALGRPGALANNPGTAVGTSGGRAVLGRNPVSAPAAYSIELWFRAVPGASGYLAGFENDRDDNPVGSFADRSVSMDGTGRLVFGRWAGRTQTITSPRAYSDGAWHHLVVTNTSARYTVMYVDGVAVAAGNTSQDSAYAGFWRIGQGSTGTSAGNTSAFTGDLDNVSIFHTVLPSARVTAHWNAR